MTGYAHPDLLCDTDWLEAHLGDPDLRIIDCGMPDAYARAHIPGAVGLPHPFLKGRGGSLHVMPAPEFEALVGERGVSNDSLVVLYDDNASLYAARVWWVFDHFGHADVRVLNGGFNRWLHQGRPLTSQVPRPVPATFRAKPGLSGLCDLGGLRSAIGDPGAVIWDVRSREEWTGENDRGNLRRGHVPDAVHLEWRALMEGPPERRFKPADELERLVAPLGITPDKRVIIY
ncbi:MAG: sulfurtransferase [Dehalococcoidia bacterium]